MAKIKHIKTISSFVLIFLMAIVLLVTLIPHLFGLNIAVIRDNAMQGSLPNGSLIFVKTTPVAEIQVGDLITYYRGEGEDILTRRVVAMDSHRQTFYTKGDRNSQAEEGSVDQSQLIGQPTFHLPYFGLVATKTFLLVGQILFWIAALTITFTTITTLIRQSRPLKKQDDPWLFEDKEQ
ncbi:signal peptidase I [Enterococcus diestrammenae]|uniref:signal peptidase I n=1 Tax=Enterococcus diestrammenae TaxID=1155073 RepID=UPI00195BB06D